MADQEKPTFYSRVMAVTLAILLVTAATGIIIKLRTDSETGKEYSFYTRVIKVIDGDTIMLEGISKPVRLLGIDTPELHHPDMPVQKGAEEARAFLEGRINERKVKAVFIKGKEHDKYGRMLAFIHADGDCINEELVAKGLAYAYEGGDSGPEREKKFMLLEQNAKKEKLGVWNNAGR